MSGRAVCGVLLLVLGGILALYFWLGFDISVAVYPAVRGSQRVVNEGLMQDRLVGILVSLGMIGLGAFLAFASSGGLSVQATKIAIPPPPPPQGFTIPLATAVRYFPQAG